MTPTVNNDPAAALFYVVFIAAAMLAMCVMAWLFERYE